MRSITSDSLLQVYLENFIFQEKKISSRRERYHLLDLFAYYKNSYDRI